MSQRHFLWTLIDQTPVPVENPLEWGIEEEVRHVADTWIGSCRVSTVFTGLATNLIGPPEVFETMVFQDGEIKGQERYATWDEAEAGHRQIVSELQRHSHKS